MGSDKDRKRRRFFDENGLDAEGTSAKEFTRRARARGFAVDPQTGDVTVGRDSVVAENLRSAIAKRQQAQDPLTVRGKAVQTEKRKLFWHIRRSGRVYVKAEEGGGTSLYWDGGHDFRGRPMRHPLRLATSSRDGLTVDDFVPDDASPVGFTAPELKESIMADRFARFYNVLTGKTSAAALTPDEQEASDYYDKVMEAGSVATGEQGRRRTDGE